MMKTRWKQWLLGGLALLLAAGCSQPASRSEPSSQPEKAQDGPVTITITAPRDTTGTMQKLVDNFNRSHSDIKVNYVQSPASADEQHDTFVTYLSAKDSSTDIYFVDVIWVPEFAEAGWAYPLDEFFTEEDKRDFLPASLEAFTYKGKLVSVPYFADGGMLYYRKDLLEKEGLKPPKDWNELVQQAKLLSQKYNIYGFTFQAAQYEGLVCNFLEYVWGNGGDFLDSQNNVVINRPEAVQALEFMSDLIHKEKVAPEGTITHKEDESLQLFIEGKAAFHRNWAYAWGVAQDKGSKVQGKVGVMPMVPAPGKAGHPVSTFGPQGYMISAFSKHPKEAWEFLKYLTGTQSQKELLLKAGYTPTRKSVYEDAEVQKQMPYLKEQLKSFEMAKPRPVHPFYPEISDVLQIQLHKALVGEVSAQQALDEAKQKIEEIVKRSP